MINRAHLFRITIPACVIALTVGIQLGRRHNPPSSLIGQPKSTQERNLLLRQEQQQDRTHTVSAVHASGENFSERFEKALAVQNSIQRSAAVLEILASAADQDVAQLMDMLDKLRSNPRSDSQQILWIAKRIGELKGISVIASIKVTTDGTLSAIDREILAGISNKDPAAIVSWWQTLPSNPTRAAAAKEIFRGLIETDEKFALSFYAKLQPQDKALALDDLFASKNRSGDPHSVFSFAENELDTTTNLSSGEASSYNGMLLRKLLEESPLSESNSTKSWIEERLNSTYLDSYSVGRFAAAMASSDPKTALDWAMTIASSKNPQLENVIAEPAKAVADIDLNILGNWLLSNPEFPGRKAALDAMVEAARKEDNVAGEEWFAYAQRESEKAIEQSSQAAKARLLKLIEEKKMRQMQGKN